VQYILTNKGKEEYKRLDAKWTSGHLAGDEDKLRELLSDIDMPIGFDLEATSFQIEKALRKGLIKEGRINPSEVLKELSLLDPKLGSAIKTYWKVANEETLGPDEIDKAITIMRGKLTEDLSSKDLPFGKLDLEEAYTIQSGGNKVIELDSLVSCYHEITGKRLSPRGSKVSKVKQLLDYLADESERKTDN